MITIQPFSREYNNEAGRFVLSVEHEFGIDITLEDQPDLADIERNYIAPGGNFWLALEDEKIVGTIAILNAGGGIGVIRKMFVAPEFRGAPHKLGQRLLDTLMPWARANGYTQLYLGTIDILQAALRFYEKNGFKRFAEDDLPCEVFDIRMPDDNVYYALELAA